MIVSWITILLMGTLLGVLGGGGSILTVPILIYLFGQSAESATSYSLGVVMFTAGIGGFRAYYQRYVVVRVAIYFGLAGGFGVVMARAFLLPQIPDQLNLDGLLISKNQFIMMLLATLMSVAGALMLLTKAKKVHLNDSRTMMSVESIAQSIPIWLIAAEGLFVGVITGLVGSGGGFLLIPALVIIVKLPMKLAVGTSLVIVSFKSAMGLAVDLARNIQIDWLQILRLAAVASLGMIGGRHLSVYVPERPLKLVFAYLVLGLAAKLFWDALVL